MGILKQVQDDGMTLRKILLWVRRMIMAIFFFNVELGE